MYIVAGTMGTEGVYAFANVTSGNFQCLCKLYTKNPLSINSHSECIHQNNTYTCMIRDAGVKMCECVHFELSGQKISI